MGNKIVLACSECATRNYSTTANHSDKRLEIKKYCKNCNKHTLHRQTK